MCVESHENVHNDESPSLTTANNAIDVMTEKIDSSHIKNTHQTDADIVTPTSFLIEKNETESSTTTITNQIDRHESKCRANGDSV